MEGKAYFPQSNVTRTQELHVRVDSLLFFPGILYLLESYSKAFGVKSSLSYFLSFFLSFLSFFSSSPPSFFFFEETFALEVLLALLEERGLCSTIISSSSPC